jgi:hypothetical protein
MVFDEAGSIDELPEALLGTHSHRDGPRSS